MNLPRLLACITGPREQFPQTLFVPGEILCGTGCPADGPAEAPRSIEISGSNFYDIRRVLAALPAALHPELCVVHVEPGLASLPTHLNGLDCRKILVLGASHYSRHAIETLLRYAVESGFHTIVSQSSRQHLHFFRSAGFERLAWIPGLTANPVALPEAKEVEPVVAVIGSLDGRHERRRRLLSRLRSAGLPVRAHGATQAEAAAVYNRSLVSVNQALNGDVNARVMEVLAAGGFLLTDRLSAQAGLEQMATPGEEMVVYDSADDLIGKVRHYLEHPMETAAVRRRGQDRYRRQHSPEMRQARFLELAVNGRSAPEYTLEADARFRLAAPNNWSQLRRRVRVYDFVQWLHGQRDSVELYFGPGADLALVQDLADLPRVRIRVACSGQSERLEWESELTRTGRPAQVDLVPVARLLDGHGLGSVLVPGATSVDETARLLDGFAGEFLLCGASEETLAPAEYARLLTVAYRAGFQASSESPAAYERPSGWAAAAAFAAVGNTESLLNVLRLLSGSDEGSADRLVDAAKAAGTLGDPELANTLLRRALALDRANGSIRAQLGAAQSQTTSRQAPQPRQILRVALAGAEPSLKAMLGRRGHALVETNPDVAIVTGGASSEWVERWSLNGVPVLYHVRGTETPAASLGAVRAVTESRRMRDHMIAHGWDEARVEVLYPGVPNAALPTDPAPDMGRLRILYAGTVGFGQGAHVLVSALLLLAERGVAFEATLAGEAEDAGYLEQLRQAVETAGLAGRVKFTAGLTEETMGTEFGRHNVAVAPALTPQAATGLDAAALTSGLLLVVSQCAGAAEFLNHGRTGIVFDTGSAEALAAYLEWMRDDRSLWGRMAAEGQQFAMGMFSPDTPLLRLEQALERTSALRA